MQAGILFHLPIIKNFISSTTGCWDVTKPDKTLFPQSFFSMGPDPLPKANRCFLHTSLVLGLTNFGSQVSWFDPSSSSVYPTAHTEELSQPSTNRDTLPFMHKHAFMFQSVSLESEKSKAKQSKEKRKTTGHYFPDISPMLKFDCL